MKEFFSFITFILFILIIILMVSEPREIGKYLKKVQVEFNEGYNYDKVDSTETESIE